MIQFTFNFKQYSELPKDLNLFLKIYQSTLQEIFFRIMPENCVWSDWFPVRIT